VQKTDASQTRGPNHPRAITIWEFSWIERRWDGAGYENWDKALDELKLWHCHRSAACRGVAVTVAVRRLYIANVSSICE